MQNFRSIADSGDLDLGPITVLIGPNNSGKSALLRALLMGHQAGSWDKQDVRFGQSVASVLLVLSKPYPEVVLHAERRNLTQVPSLSLRFEGRESQSSFLTWPTEGSEQAETGYTVSSRRPTHLFVPILNRRRASTFETAVDREAGTTVGFDDRSLVSRLQALAGDHSEGRRYRELVDRILGLTVSTFPVQGGAAPGIQLSTSAGITLDRMGDGVRNIVVLASELVDDEHARIFLIEEPENDLHPGALLMLLDVIREFSDHHQFIVTTHSDVVLRELGSVTGGRVYETANDSRDSVPTSTYRPLNDEFGRRAALHSLGYEQELPIGWLVLEESTAERFIRDCLIPLFVPRLAVLRTVSAGGSTNVNRTVVSLHRMVLFARLVERDHPRAWVLVDGDDAGRKAVGELRAKFNTWPAGRFGVFSREDIELYYPAEFAHRLTEIQTSTKWSETQRLKGRLVEDVVAWSVTDPKARTLLEKSAADVIAELRRVESEIINLQRDPPQQLATPPGPGIKTPLD